MGLFYCVQIVPKFKKLGVKLKKKNPKVLEGMQK